MQFRSAGETLKVKHQLMTLTRDFRVDIVADWNDLRQRKLSFADQRSFAQGRLDHLSGELVVEIRETLIDDLPENTLERRTRSEVHRLQPSNLFFSLSRLTFRSSRYIPFRTAVEG